MEVKNNIYLVIFGFFILAVFIIFATFSYTSNKQNELLKSVYQFENKSIVEKTKSLIVDKQHTTLSIALALSKNENLYKYISNGEFSKLDFKDISKKIKDNSKYKNIWIQILDRNKNSIYRSWTDYKDDNVNFRLDLQNQKELQNISTSVSVGIFNMTLKARSPIFDNQNNFYGALEVVTHFESIVEDLKASNINSIVLADKKFKNIIKYPFSNTFINDYYVAHNNFDLKYLDYLKDNGIEKYINIENFIVENGYLISKYPLIDKNGNSLGYIINFLDLKNINFENINFVKFQSITTAIITLIVLFIALILYLYNIYIINLKNQEHKSRLILDSQANIVIITNGVELIEANQKLIDFYSDVKTLDEFKEKYTCICSQFLDIGDENYLLHKDYSGKNWIEYSFLNKDKEFKVAIKNDKDEIHHFKVVTSKTKLEEAFYIVTFIDITSDILRAQKEKNEQKIILQQSRINAISSALNNVAHHWRQPLSTISTAASGIKLKQEMNNLSDKELGNYCDNIILNTQKLSNTIENFTNFFANEEAEINCSLIETIKNITLFFETIFDKHSIKCEFTYSKDLIINCSYTNLSEALINIFDNSIQALQEVEDKNKRVILINFENNILTIKDSANGVKEELLPKITDPYFTTKHQSYGTGLGLFVVREFFEVGLNFKISFKNEFFTHNNNNFYGLCFIVEFN